MEGIDKATEDVLARYLKDVSTLPNEAAKTHRFAALVADLFRGSEATIELARGIEKRVRIDLSNRVKKGRMDAYFGNVIIEFENSLKATEKSALQQLREYTAGVWAKEGRPFRTLVCVATDGLVWKAFLPRTTWNSAESPRPDDVELDPILDLCVAPETLRQFWLWLTSLLFREAVVPPTAERFSFDFGAMSPAYVDGMKALQRAWDEVGDTPEPGLAFDTWRTYLTVTYGSVGSKTDELVTLFLKHTYLACIARFLVWAALSSGKTRGSYGDVAMAVLSGDYFRSRGIENLVEDDFFQWVRHSTAATFLTPVWERVIAQMRTYDLGRISQDILKGVYQELVDPKDRHDLGEYYTPDWLCDRVVNHVLPSEGFVTVLDPACGSGSFLHAAITHMLSRNEVGSDEARLANVLTSVVGIDIHPAAVTIAKTTYLLAVLPLMKAAKRPVQVPVYLADSLFLPGEVQQLELGRRPGLEVRFGGQAVIIPNELIASSDVFDPAITACAKVAVDHAASGKENRESLARYLEKAVPGMCRLDDTEEAKTALWAFTETLSRLIRKKKNSIWAFIVRNGYRPAMLRGKFKYIVGNPPWLSYRYIADPKYQAEIKERAVKQYAIAPKSQRLFTQMELATVFLAHTLTTFGESGARLGFVMPRSVLSADQHQALRGRKYSAPFLIDEYWDLKDVAPVFRVPSCVLFAAKTHAQPASNDSYAIPATEWSGHLPHRDVPWRQAQLDLKTRKTQARLIWLGSRSAWSTRPGAAKPTSHGPYFKRFSQGATIVPHSFFFVSLEHARDLLEADTLYAIRTDREQARSAKAPYNDIDLAGAAQGRFLFCTALSRHVLPYILSAPPLVVLPAVVVDGTLRLQSPAKLREMGFREIASWMEKVEQLWEAKRGSKAKQQSVYQWLDYSGKLSAQDTRQRFVVLYNAPGTNVSAVRVDTTRLPAPFIAEHTLYRGAFADLCEADYVTAILNSAVVDETIKPFQAMGLQGERHVEKKVLELPIPLYTRSDPDHVRLAALSAKAHAVAAEFVAAATLPRSLARQRATVRDHLRPTLDEIDTIVEKILR